MEQIQKQSDTGKLLQAVKSSLRWTGIGLIPGKRTMDYCLDYPFPMRYIGSHTYTYAGIRSFACNWVFKTKEVKLESTTPNRWLEHGCIVFSQYYDTALWIAKELAKILDDWYL